MHKIINEGSIRLKAPKTEKISKAMGVFYNPAMGLNRDISILLLNAINRDNLQIADPMAASGVRSIRFLKELANSKIKRIFINDYDKNAVRLIRQNLEINKIKYKNNKKVRISNDDANLFLLNSTGFDYIDIDPFGTPNPFLDAACRRIARGGILAVTATDTSALCGTFPKACMRKYWGLPKKDAVMHETGLRILIRKIQLIAAQYGKALTPIFCYSKEHYMRVFLMSEKSRNNADDVIKRHGSLNGAGPMWLGSLWDGDLTCKMHKNALKNRIFRKDNGLIKLLKLIKEESKINAVGFYDLHDACEKNHIRNLTKKSELISKIKKLGYKASETHFRGEGIRSNIPNGILVRILQNK